MRPQSVVSANPLQIDEKPRQLLRRNQECKCAQAGAAVGVFWFLSTLLPAVVSSRPAVANGRSCASARVFGSVYIRQLLLAGVLSQARGQSIGAILALRLDEGEDEPKLCAVDRRSPACEQQGGRPEPNSRR